MLKYFNGTTISRFLLAFMFPHSVFSPFSWFAFAFSCNTTFVFKTLRICYRICIVVNRRRVIIIKRRIIRFMSVIIPQTTCCFSIIFTVLKQIVHWHHNIYITALSINTLFIFDMQLISVALFLNAKNLFLNVNNSSSVYFCKSNISFHNNIPIRIIT